eukprot:97576_1
MWFKLIALSWCIVQICGQDCDESLCEIPDPLTCDDGQSYDNKCQAECAGFDCHPEKGVCSGGKCCNGDKGSCQPQAGEVGEVPPMPAPWKSYTLAGASQTTMVILLFVFCGCFMSLGLVIGSFYFNNNRNRPKSLYSDSSY